MMMCAQKSGVEQPQAEPNASQHMSTQLLGEAFAACETDQPITVLDFGPGSGPTLSFLANYRAIIHFADLVRTPVQVAVPEDTTEIQISELLARQLAIEPDAKFDVVLFWDYLHLFEPTSLAALSKVLAPHLHERSRGYGFGALRAKQTLPSCTYGIANAHEVVVHPISGLANFVGYTQQRLADHFDAMQIARATLLQEGRLELLFDIS